METLFDNSSTDSLLVGARAGTRIHLGALVLEHRLCKGEVPTRQEVLNDPGEFRERTHPPHEYPYSQNPPPPPFSLLCPYPIDGVRGGYPRGPVTGP